MASRTARLGPPCLPLVLAAGCFAELRAGYYPSLDGAAGADLGEGPTRGESGFLLGGAVGLRADLYGVAIAVAPGLAAGNLRGVETLRGRAQLVGDAYRLDVELPLRGFRGSTGRRVRPRLTLAVDRFDHLNIQYPNGDLFARLDGATGTQWFSGVGVAAPGGLASLVIGPSVFSVGAGDGASRIDLRGWGGEARLGVAVWIPWREPDDHPGAPWYTPCVRPTYGGWRC